MSNLVVITISGPHGSGKSTIAKAIAEALHLKYVSSGQTFRELAKEQGCDLETFSQMCEGNSEIDNKIDQITLDEAKKGNVVLEGQLASWMAKDFSDFNIYVTASLDVRVKRIALRDDYDFDKAKQETLIRTKSAVARFKLMYDIDTENKDIYDLILNTDRLNKDQCVNILVAVCKEL